MKLDNFSDYIRTIIFIFIVIFTTFRPMRPSVFFKCFILNLVTYTELKTELFIQYTGLDCLIWFGFVWFHYFNDISTFVGHLLPKPSF